MGGSPATGAVPWPVTWTATEEVGEVEEVTRGEAFTNDRPADGCPADGCPANGCPADGCPADGDVTSHCIQLREPDELEAASTRMCPPKPRELVALSRSSPLPASGCAVGRQTRPPPSLLV